MRAIYLTSIVMLVALAAGCRTPLRVPIVICDEKDSFFVPIGAKIVIPAGSTWVNKEGTIKQKWDKEKVYTIEERSMAFTAPYVDEILLAREALLARQSE